MQPRSARFDRALRRPHTAITAASVQLGTGDPLPLRVVGGSVTISADPGVRRSLNVEIVNTGREWAALQPDGAIVYVVRGIVFADGSQEHVALGSFRIDDTSLAYSGNQSISVTAGDRWGLIQDQQFEVTTKPTRGTYVEEILHLMAVGGGGFARSTATHDQPIPSKGITYGTSREDAIYSLAQAIGADVAYSADGVAEVRDLPTVKAPSVWSVDAGQFGVLTDAQRDRTRTDTFNVIVVQPSAPNGKPLFAQVVVTDDDTSSPTWVGGSFGRKPRFIQSDLITTLAQAEHVGACQLAQSTGLHSQLTLASVGQPALDVLDSIDVVFPARLGMPVTVERHLVDSITFNLDGSAQTITTRAIGAAESPTGLSS